MSPCPLRLVAHTEAPPIGCPAASVTRPDRVTVVTMGAGGTENAIVVVRPAAASTGVAASGVAASR